MPFLLKITKLSIICSLLFSLLTPLSKVSASNQTSAQKFSSDLSRELNAYIKKNGGDITLQYLDLTNTKEQFHIKGTSSRSAASTIKLPLALYVMELAEQKKINLNQKLTYKSYHYYGGSGIIQKDRVGSQYTIRDLVKKSMIYSDNIAFIMLKEKVGRANFNQFLKKAGGQYAYPNGQNRTSSKDLTAYAHRLYQFSQKSSLGEELMGYLKTTVYNTTIPKGIKGAEVAHKVGMIPMNNIYNDIGIIFDKNPFILAVMTNKLPYEKSQRVIAEISSIVYKFHKTKHSQAKYFITNKDTYVYSNTKVKVGKLLKSQAFKITGDQNEMYEIDFGTKKGFVLKKDITSYPNAIGSGFDNGKLKNNGLLKVNRTTNVLLKASTEGTKLATFYQGNELYFNAISGDYYKVTIGERIGYVHHDAVNLQFTKAIKYIKVKNSLAIYKNIEGELVQIGTINKDEIYPRIKESGDWHIIQFGATQGYIKKSGTQPIFQANITDSAENQITSGEVQVIENATVYTSLSDQSKAIGTILMGQKIAYIEKLDNGYSINFSGRIGYIKKEVTSD